MTTQRFVEAGNAFESRIANQHEQQQCVCSHANSNEVNAFESGMKSQTLNPQKQQKLVCFRTNTSNVTVSESSMAIETLKFHKKRKRARASQQTQTMQKI
ncbi:MAG: hypothetical protein VX933_04570 [Bacteroidota bacterium]|nr:hypothetical protein [Bacteroidota bacterium]